MGENPEIISKGYLSLSFAYIHSEKDILKLVTTLIANTKGEGKAGDDFWVKAETLLYCALIGYIHYEAPVEEQNFSTLIEFINAMEVREDDEEFKNPVDLMFDALEAEKPNHFAVRQYKKYKLAAGVVCSKRLLNQAVGKSLRTHNLKPKKGAQVMRKNEKITALYERLSVMTLAKMMTSSVRAIPFPIKRLCWRSSPHGRGLRTLSISRTMALVVLALTVPDFWQ